MRAGYHGGLGFTPGYMDSPDYPGVDTPAGFVDALGTSINRSVAAFDWASLDWHEWALIVIGGYVVYRAVARGARRAGENVRGKVRRVKRGASKRSAALKTVFTGA